MKTARVETVSAMPREKTKTTATTKGSNRREKPGLMPDKRMIMKSGTREKMKCTSDDETMESGKTAFGKYILLMRLRFWRNAIEAILVPWEKNCQRIIPDIAYVEYFPVELPKRPEKMT
jgi:hypothetical protein